MSETHQPLTGKKKRRKPWVTWAMGCLFALGLVYWYTGKQTLDYARSLVADHYAEIVQEKIRERDWAEASQNLIRARSWLVTHPPVMRAYADLLIANRSDNLALLQILRQLDEKKLATPQDRTYIGQILISLGHIDAARNEYEKLPEAQKQTSDSMELLASLHRAEGHEKEANDLLRKALSLAPENLSSRLRLAIMDHQKSFPEIQARARQDIWEIAQSQDVVSQQAIEFLSNQVQINGEEAESLLQLIDRNPSVAPKTRYAALSARLRARPQDRNAMLESEIQRVKGQGVETLAPALSWLLQENQPEHVIKLLPDRLYLKSGQLLNPYLISLSLLGRWHEIETLLNTEKSLPVSETYLHLWKARAADKLNSGINTVRHHLETAFAQTKNGKDEASAVMAAEIAEKMGQWDLASRYYNEIATKQPLNRGPMWEKVHEMALRGRDTDSALNSAQNLADLHPENYSLTQRVLYLQLVAGEKLESSLKTLTDRPFSEGSAAPLGHLISALGAYRMGDLSKSGKDLEAISDLDSLTPGQRAIHAGLLSLCGKVGPAYQLAEKIPSILLLPEEMRFLTRAL